MATTPDLSGNTPSYPKGGDPRTVDTHIKSKLELVIDASALAAVQIEFGILPRLDAQTALLTQIEANTEA